MSVIFFASPLRWQFWVASRHMTSAHHHYMETIMRELSNCCFTQLQNLPHAISNLFFAAQGLCVCVWFSVKRDVINKCYTINNCWAAKKISETMDLHFVYNDREIKIFIRLHCSRRRYVCSRWKGEMKNFNKNESASLHRRLGGSNRTCEGLTSDGPTEERDIFSAKYIKSLRWDFHVNTTWRLLFLHFNAVRRTKQSNEIHIIFFISNFFGRLLHAFEEWTWTVCVLFFLSS